MNGRPGLWGNSGQGQGDRRFISVAAWSERSTGSRSPSRSSHYYHSSILHRLKTTLQEHTPLPLPRIHPTKSPRITQPPSSLPSSASNPARSRLASRSRGQPTTATTCSCGANSQGELSAAPQRKKSICRARIYPSKKVHCFLLEDLRLENSICPLRKRDILASLRNDRGLFGDEAEG